MFQQKKPYSAVTVTIENLTSESYAEDDFSGIPDLVEVIKLQASGPTEAARAIRKKLKYGNVHRQLRALSLLDGLIQNAGPQFQRAFADEPLLERLRVCGSSDLSDPAVKKKCRELFAEWTQYKSVSGLERISRLHKELPKRKVGVTQERSKVIKETEDNPFGDDEEEEAMRAAEERAKAGPSSSAAAAGGGSATSKVVPGPSNDGFHAFSPYKDKDKKKDKSKGKRRGFNLEAEKEQMKTVIAESSMASTNLVNALQSLNREVERASDNELVIQRFEICKQLRRRVLRYIHRVDHEQWLGSLLHANDELVHALMTYEQLDQSIDADSDSDDEIAEQAHLYRMIAQRGKDEQGATAQVPDVGGLHISPLPDGALPPKQPPRPPMVSPGTDLESASEEEDDDDPFADRNVADTPAVERAEPRW